jgi:hypothetical protein
MSNQSNNFNTPIELIEPIKEFFGGEIDLDPCSNEFSVVGAKNLYSLPTDGLKEKWGGNIFSNPPFAPYYIKEGKVITPAQYKELVDKIGWVRYTIKNWVKKGVETSINDKSNVLFLLPSRGTGNSLWQDYIFPTFDAICFLNKRVYFWEQGHPVYDLKGKPQPAEFDCALVLFSQIRDLVAKFKNDFSNFGYVLER